MSSELSYLIRSIFESILTFGCIITPIALFFVAYNRKKRAEHELRMRLLESNSDPELIKALIETKPKTEPKLVLLRIGLPAIFSSIFGIIFFYVMNELCNGDFNGAVLTLILVIILGIGLGLVSALVIEHKLLKKTEQTK